MARAMAWWLACQGMVAEPDESSGGEKLNEAGVFRELVAGVRF